MTYKALDKDYKDDVIFGFCYRTADKWGLFFPMTSSSYS